MKRIERDIREQFRITDRNVAIDEKRKEESLSFLQKEFSKKKAGILHSRKKILLRQFWYMDKSMFGIHIVFCILSLAFIVFLHEYAGNGNLSVIEEEHIILTATIVSCILGVISILGIVHVFYAGIAELSESCYFNVRQMVAFRMFLSGIISLTILTIDILFIGMRWKMNLLRVGLYIFVPFLITECFCLMIVLSEAGRKNIYPLVAAGIFSVAVNGFLAVWQELYRMTALFVWGIAFVIGLLLFAVQMNMLFRGIEKGEILCTN